MNDGASCTDGDLEVDSDKPVECGEESILSSRDGKVSVTNGDLGYLSRSMSIAAHSWSHGFSNLPTSVLLSNISELGDHTEMVSVLKLWGSTFRVKSSGTCRGMAE